MKRADAAAGKFEATNKDLAESFDNGETKLMGTADLLDGLATTMGLNVGAAIEMSRGFADMASGIKTTVIPALQRAAASAKSFSTTLLATPWGRVAAGVAVVGTALVAASADGDQFGKALAALKLGVQYDIDKVREFSNSVIGLFGVTADADPVFQRFGYTLDQTGFNMNAVGEAAAYLTAQQHNAASASQTFGQAIEQAQASTARYEAQLKSAAQAAKNLAIANALGGTVTDPDGMFASAAAIEELNSSGSQSLSAQFASSAAKATKAVKSGVKKIADTATAEFRKQLPKLRDAAKDFTDAMSLKTALKGNFGLGFGDDLGHNVTESLHRQVAQFREFVRKLASLRKMGLPESLARQFADAGPAALEEMNRINSGNIGEIKKLAKEAGQVGGQFSTDETKRRTGVDPNKPVKVVIDVRGGDGDLKNMIKKWVRTDGGGKVEVAFR